MSKKKQIRRKFRDSVFKRDKYTCIVCNKKHVSSDTLDAHHITNRNELPNGGYVLENGATLCKDSCHLDVEEFYWSDRKQPSTLSPESLYKKINSSYELAYEKSLKLS